jgi:preprotein translocase subunit SecG
MRFEISNVLAFLFLSTAIILIVRSRHKEHGAEKKWAYLFLMAGAFLFMMSLVSLLLP